MSLRQTNLLIIFSFFPVFVFRSDLNGLEIFNSIIIFVLPILFINFFLIKNILNNSFLKIYYAFIITFGIDNNIGLWNGIIVPSQFYLMEIFKIIYISGFIIFIILMILIYLLILKNDKKFYNVILIFITVLFIFNIFDQTKSYKSLPYFVNDVDKNHPKTELVIIFDEMSGLNSYESLSDEGIEFNILAKKFFKKYNFEFYTNIKSIDSNTGSSVSSLLNFSNDASARNIILDKSNNYFISYNLTKSLFFEKFTNISIFQSGHINYCNFKNVFKCDTYSPFSKNGYLTGYKNTFLTKIISLWKINGSISSTLAWRFFRELEIIDSNLEPEGHKATFQDLFKKINNDVDTGKHDLIFVHTLVPHVPYGFNKDCTYDGQLSTLNSYYSTIKKIKQHNIERKCVLIYLESFLEKLIFNKKLDSVNLTILSDHGARILSKDSSSLSTIYAYRDSQTTYKEFKSETITQKIFSKRFN